MKGLPAWILGLTLCTAVASAEDPVRLGFIFWTSGHMGTSGAIARQGAVLAMDEINKGGGIKGRTLQGFFEDSAGDPDVAKKVFRKLVEQNRVDAVIGLLSEDVAPVVATMAREAGIPLIITGAQGRSVTGKKCNHFTFRLCPNSLHNAKTGAFLASWTKALHWTAVASDNPTDRELWGEFKRFLLQIKPSVSFVDDSKATFVKSERANWLQTIDAIKKSRADGVLICLQRRNFIDFVKNGTRRGLFDGTREFIVVMGGVAELLALGRDMPKGIWFSSPYWHQAGRGPTNAGFTTAYESKYGVPPSWQAQFSYGGVKAYANAVEAAGSPNKTAVVRALEGMSLDLPVGEVTFRPQDHQAVMHTMGGKTGRIAVTARHKSFRGLGSVVLFRVKEIAESGLERECTMK